jgi:hypothetical protein
MPVFKWFDHLKTGPKFFLTSSLVFIIKQSRLVPTIWKPDYLSRFQMVRFSDARDWHKIQSESRPRFGILWVTVIVTCSLDNTSIQSNPVNQTSSVIERPLWPITGYMISGRHMYIIIAIPSPFQGFVFILIVYMSNKTHFGGFI